MKYLDFQVSIESANEALKQAGEEVKLEIECPETGEEVMTRWNTLLPDCNMTKRKDVVF